MAVTITVLLMWDCIFTHSAKGATPPPLCISIRVGASDGKRTGHGGRSLNKAGTHCQRCNVNVLDAASVFRLTKQPHFSNSFEIQSYAVSGVKTNAWRWLPLSESVHESQWQYRPVLNSIIWMGLLGIVAGSSLKTRNVCQLFARPYRGEMRSTSAEPKVGEVEPAFNLLLCLRPRHIENIVIFNE